MNLHIYTLLFSLLRDRIPETIGETIDVLGTERKPKMKKYYQALHKNNI